MQKIEIKGTIVSDDDKWIYDYLGIGAVSPKDINSALKNAKGEEIEIDINSGGGDIFAGSEIRTAIASYKGLKKINIVGLAASAASVISTAAKSFIAPTGMFMLHNVSSGASGDYRDMQHASEVLLAANKSISNAYREKTGLSETELLAIMDKETWLSAEDAVRMKFVDGIMLENQFVNKNKVNFYNGSMIPVETIEKIRNTIKKPNETDQKEINSGLEAQKMIAQLNILKLKGEII